MSAAEKGPVNEGEGGSGRGRWLREEGEVDRRRRQRWDGKVVREGGRGKTKDGEEGRRKEGGRREERRREGRRGWKVREVRGKLGGEGGDCSCFLIQNWSGKELQLITYK